MKIPRSWLRNDSRALVLVPLVIVVVAGLSWSAKEPKPPAPAATVQLGPNADLSGRRVFPEDNAWNLDISHVPVDPNSATYIAAIGANAPLHPDFGTVYEGVPWGIPYVVVPGNQPRLPVNFEWADESDLCMYPIPPNPPIEGGGQAKGDRHILMIDRDNWKLYELFSASKDQAGNWKASAGAVFDLKSNNLRPAGWTSADAAGLPVFPGLVRYDEVVQQKEIRHALRFTARRTRRAYIYPARHWASRLTDPNLPPMGLRVRLKASYDVSGFSPTVQVILKALQKYGMFLADNGGSWYLTGAPDPRWNDADIETMKKVKGSDFEVIRIGNIVTP